MTGQAAKKTTVSAIIMTTQKMTLTSPAAMAPGITAMTALSTSSIRGDREGVGGEDDAQDCDVDADLGAAVGALHVDRARVRSGDLVDDAQSEAPARRRVTAAPGHAP